MTLYSWLVYIILNVQIFTTIASHRSNARLMKKTGITSTHEKISNYDMLKKIDYFHKMIEEQEMYNSYENRLLLLIIILEVIILILVIIELIEQLNKYRKNKYI